MNKKMMLSGEYDKRLRLVQTGSWCRINIFQPL